MLIDRDWTRSEEDDFKLNVEDKLSPSAVAQPIYGEPDDIAVLRGVLVGWKIVPQHE